MNNRTKPAYLLRPVEMALLFFIIALASRQLLFAYDPYKTAIQQLPDILRWLERPVRWTIFVGLGLWVVHRKPVSWMVRELGLTGNARQGLWLGFLACSPMLVMPMVLGRFTATETVLRIVFMSAIWPLGEEILFRGYVFGQLVKRGGMNLWAAAITTGFVFGILHLGQAAVQNLPLSGEIGTVAIVSIGGIFFAWLFATWDYNLWVPMGMHLFMNLWWSVFDMADSPLGGWLPNVLRLVTVVLAIVLTVYRDRWPVLRLNRQA
ncbi:lysostaphin resistance A-like protein [Candidatus Neomarinimicrobiota bacterium]